MKKTIGVIGAGMVGVAAASFLQREGHDVVLVEPGNPGEGTSFGNAGCLNGSSVVPMSMPGTIRNVPRWLTDPMGPLVIRWSYLPTLAPWLIRFIAAGRPEKVREQAKALRAILGPSLATLAPLLKDAGAEDLVKKAGHLFVYRSEASFRKESLAWQLRRDNSVTWDEFDADELRQLEPTLSRDYVKGVLVAENGHTTNPHRLVDSLAQSFLRNGGRIERARASGFALDGGGRLTGIRTDGGVVAADGAVVAAGVWSKPLAAELGDDLPLETERGYHLMIRDPEAAPNWERARVLLRHVHRMFPALKESYPEERISTWMGHRPSLPDSLPAIGRSRRSPDVVYAFGHGHVGMAGAPMTGKLVAELLSGKTPSVDLSPFSPARFG